MAEGYFMGFVRAILCEWQDLNASLSSNAAGAGANSGLYPIMVFFIIR